jgi:hypothetical protein
MNKFITSLVISIGLVSLSLADTAATQCDEDLTVEQGWSAFGDVLLVRPVGTAVTIASFGIFAVASPFAAMADATDQVFDTLVQEPADYTFNRDLGEFNK